MDLGRVDGGGHDRASVIGVVNGPDLHIVRREGLAVHAQPARAAPVFNRGEPGSHQPRHAWNELDPGVVGDTAQKATGPSVRVGPQHPECALIPGLDRQDQPVGAPAHPCQVFPAALVPGHVHRAGTGRAGPTAAVVAPGVENGQAHLGVGRSGGRVAHLDRLGLGRRRIGDPPARHTGGVHPGRQQAPTVRRPPVAPGEAHLLGRHELGRSPAHRVTGLLGDDPVAGGVPGHPQGRSGHVGDPRAAGREPRVERARP